MAYLSYSNSIGEGSVHGQHVQHVPFPTTTGSSRSYLLHGNLDIWVKSAKNLPNLDMINKSLGDVFGKLSGKLMNKLETSDPYVTISVGGAVIARTYVIEDNENPVWDQHFHVPVAHYGTEVLFVVKDSDVVGSELIGGVAVPMEPVASGARLDATYPILGPNGRPCNPGALLSLSIQYIPIETISLYRGGVGLDPTHPGVPGTYFPVRRGGRVTLYQDAHVYHGMLPNLWLANGMMYQHRQCWRDIFDSIVQARRLIYITGWSVYHLVQLVRDDPNLPNTNLGELLKVKSQEGVRVLLLVWDDPTSTTILGYRTEGVMGTGDDDTRRYFKHSSVHVLLCPRSAGKGSWAKKQETGTIYTHHQKSVVVDVEAHNHKRKLIAYVGGLDLCKGRYDTPHHTLFSTLETIHKDDFHQPNFTGNMAGCPREPWHDLHSKLKLRIPDIVGIDESSTIEEHDPESWNVQVFRSIDSNSVKGFPKDSKEASSKNLVCGKNVLIDMSIHTAYVKAIRGAQHYIYIENQYFLGSSYNWAHYKDLGANNLIPMEIAMKVANKIRARERFAAYIVVPMWPEGVPTSTPTQRILFWQYNTMQMMYDTVYKALKETGQDSEFEPQDYLNFFCLGNREPEVGGPPSMTPNKYTPEEPEIQKLPWVHISLNTWASKSANPRGEIFGYRMSLWAEHTGTLEQCYEQPESVECVRRIRWMGELNWKAFESDEMVPLRGHLMKYPVQVDSLGKVRSLPSCETFPDMGGKIIGTFTGLQENLTI
ncbi:UNVERIFIED_CONTAM: Phospholipase D beta 1 [Sesamum angustifolium]|uniref:Phospholipase D n=1 Tax=Sesamum angustifolium TaxID=2727405 RepID=A0AAW2MIL1_9LAMI